MFFYYTDTHHYWKTIDLRSINDIFNISQLPLVDQIAAAKSRGRY